MSKMEWKKPIYKNDLISVLINGLVAAVLGGIVAGLFDYLLSMMHLLVSFGLVIIVLLVSYRTKGAYYSYHVLYPVLSLVFLIIGYWFSYYAKVAATQMIVLEDFAIYKQLADGTFWLGFLLDPVDTFLVGCMTLDFLNIALGTINISVYVWSFFFTFRMVKNGRR